MIKHCTSGDMPRSSEMVAALAARRSKINGVVHAAAANRLESILNPLLALLTQSHQVTHLSLTPDEARDFAKVVGRNVAAALYALGVTQDDATTVCLAMLGEINEASKKESP